ncbi:hypothetical protein V8F06_002238 [Rhypophila decipiens]
MDDTARLVSELYGKLDELNGKVAAYQKDIIAEFRRHMDACLKDYPDHVSTQVSRVIAESMHKYPALNLPLTGQDDAPSPTDDVPVDRKLRDGRKSPPPILYHTSGVPKEGLRSPHDREKEFQGVFTPSYLPLLDGSFTSSPSSPMPPGPSFPLSVENVRKAEEARVKKSADPRPQPVRRLTDRSSSIDSTISDTKVRRSALRRTSSSTKGSPRRVRFDFQGSEVLPSVSPEETVVPGTVGGSDGPSSPVAESVPETSAIALEDESSAYTGTSLLDVEGEEDFLPRPKKVSSTQALQALTRSPLESDGTVWTMVNSEPDEPAKMNGDDVMDPSSKPATTEKAVTPAKPELKVSVRPTAPPPKPVPVPDSDASGRIGTHSHDEDESSDEEFLSIKPKSPKTTSPVARSPVVPPSATKSKSPLSGSNRSASRNHEMPSHVEDEDPLFNFEEEGDGTSDTRNRSKVKKYGTDAEGDDEVVRAPERPRGGSTSVAGPGEPASPEEPPVALPAVSPSAALFSHSVGSYKGHSVMISPISNPRLYDEIASMDDVPHPFVGGIDGRTGVDTADMGSYRANLTRNLAGTPRSFTERLALEEAMERRRAGRGT